MPGKTPSAAIAAVPPARTPRLLAIGLDVELAGLLPPDGVDLVVTGADFDDAMRQSLMVPPAVIALRWGPSAPRLLRAIAHLLGPGTLQLVLAARPDDQSPTYVPFIPRCQTELVPASRLRARVIEVIGILAALAVQVTAR